MLKNGTERFIRRENRTPRVNHRPSTKSPIGAFRETLESARPQCVDAGGVWLIAGCPTVEPGKARRVERLAEGEVRATQVVDGVAEVSNYAESAGRN